MNHNSGWHGGRQLSNLRPFRDFNCQRLSYLLGAIVVLTGCTNPVRNSDNLPPPSSPSPTPLSSDATSGAGSGISSPVPTDSAETPSPAASLPNKSERLRSLESQLRDTVAKSIGVPVDSVECPTEAALNAGDRVNCRLSADGQSFGVAVELQGDGSQFQWNTVGLLVLPKLEAFIQTRLKEKSGIEATATCGKKIRVARPGETFDCQVKDTQGRSRSVQVTVKDEQGGVDIKLL